MDQCDQLHRGHPSVEKGWAVAADIAPMNADQRDHLQRCLFSVEESRAVTAADIAATSTDQRDQQRGQHSMKE
eukprot:3612486-Karenia_brevis.AAC.1